MFNRTGVKHFFIVSCIAAIAFPLINLYILFPSFTGLIVRNTESDAANVAKNMSSMVISKNKGLKAPRDFADDVNKTREQFNIIKIKVFSDDGRVIYSTEDQDIGEVNKKEYFHEAVARGIPYTTTVIKDKRSLEGKVMKADVVETYVPIMKNGKFLGAFEIYYDITGKNLEINKMLFRSSLISFALMFVFFVSIMFVLYRTEKNAEKSTSVKANISYRSPLYLVLVTIVSLFIADTIIMFFMSEFPPMSEISEAVIGSILLVMMVSPIFYFFIFRPLIINIEKRRQAESMSRQARKDWEDTFNIITDVITIHDDNYNIIRANKAARDVLSLPSDNAMKLKCFKFYHGTEDPPEGCPSCQCLKTAEPANFELFEKHLDKCIEIRAIPRSDNDKCVTGIIHVVRDITERKDMEEKLKTMSLTDELTGLYNRRGFFALFNRQLQCDTQKNKRAFLLYADIDEFKIINDSHGHKEGDRVLIDVADILRSAFRGSDIIARIGGDEFVVFLEAAVEEDADAIVERLQQKISEHNFKHDRVYEISISIGVVPYIAGSSASVDELLAEADHLMYHQKKTKN